MWWMNLTVKHCDRKRSEYPGAENDTGARQDSGEPQIPAEDADGQWTGISLAGFGAVG